MWSKLRDLVTRAADAVGVEAPELPDVTVVTEQLTGEQLSGAADTLTRAGTDALNGAADATTDVTQSTQVQAVGDAASGVTDALKGR